MQMGLRVGQGGRGAWDSGPRRCLWLSPGRPARDTGSAKTICGARDGDLPGEASSDPGPHRRSDTANP